MAIVRNDDIQGVWTYLETSKMLHLTFDSFLHLRTFEIIFRNSRKKIYDRCYLIVPLPLYGMISLHLLSINDVMAKSFQLRFIAVEMKALDLLQGGSEFLGNIDTFKI